MVISPIIVYLVTIVLAALPVIELRGAMPLGMSSAIWGDSALSLGESALASVIGGILGCFVVVTVFLPLKKLLYKNKYCKKFFDHFEIKANEQIERFLSKKQRKNAKNRTKSNQNASTMHSTVPHAIQFPTPQKAKDNTFWRCLFVFLFCAAPLPFTGVWSAGALCSLLNVRYFPGVLTLILANLTGSGMVTIFCWLFQSYIDLILTIMAIILIIITLYYAAKILTSKTKKKDNSTFCD